eukprot:TRINITY_DN32825_c0_g1_i1.p1 TRINITY_DN32825_c0_g1~~TRINITY_DN32825_c0_g1_i1.p1  ORF type:complete len:815 (+),score=153.62 TRINITY_DN32825_c0_g1_i1:73-2517(+)
MPHPLKGPRPARTDVDQTVTASAVEDTLDIGEVVADQSSATSTQGLAQPSGTSSSAESKLPPAEQYARASDVLSWLGRGSEEARAQLAAASTGPIADLRTKRLRQPDSSEVQSPHSPEKAEEDLALQRPHRQQQPQSLRPQQTLTPRPQASQVSQPQQPAHDEQHLQPPSLQQRPQGTLPQQGQTWVHHTQPQNQVLPGVLQPSTQTLQPAQQTSEEKQIHPAGFGASEELLQSGLAADSLRQPLRRPCMPSSSADIVAARTSPWVGSQLQLHYAGCNSSPRSPGAMSPKDALLASPMRSSSWLPLTTAPAAHVVRTSSSSATSRNQTAQVVHGAVTPPCPLQHTPAGYTPISRPRSVPHQRPKCMQVSPCYELPRKFQGQAWRTPDFESHSPALQIASPTIEASRWASSPMFSQRHLMAPPAGSEYPVTPRSICQSGSCTPVRASVYATLQTKLCFDVQAEEKQAPDEVHQAATLTAAEDSTWTSALERRSPHLMSFAWDEDAGTDQLCQSELQWEQDAGGHAEFNQQDACGPEDRSDEVVSSRWEPPEEQATIEQAVMGNSVAEANEVGSDPAAFASSSAWPPSKLVVEPLQREWHEGDKRRPGRAAVAFSSAEELDSEADAACWRQLRDQLNALHKSVHDIARRKPDAAEVRAPCLKASTGSKAAAQLLQPAQQQAVPSSLPTCSEESQVRAEPVATSTPSTASHTSTGTCGSAQGSFQQPQIARSGAIFQSAVELRSVAMPGKHSLGRTDAFARLHRALEKSESKPVSRSGRPVSSHGRRPSASRVQRATSTGRTTSVSQLWLPESRCRK